MYSRPTPRPMMVTVDDLGRFATSAERHNAERFPVRALQLAMSAVPVYSGTVVWGSSDDVATPVTSRRALKLAAAAVAVTDCERCGNPFPAARSTARFCSGSCRVAANRALT